MKNQDRVQRVSSKKSPKTQGQTASPKLRKAGRETRSIPVHRATWDKEQNELTDEAKARREQAWRDAIIKTLAAASEDKVVNVGHVLLRSKVFAAMGGIADKAAFNSAMGDLKADGLIAGRKNWGWLLWPCKENRAIVTATEAPLKPVPLAMVEEFTDLVRLANELEDLTGQAAALLYSATIQLSNVWELRRKDCPYEFENADKMRHRAFKLGEDLTKHADGLASSLHGCLLAGD